MVTEVRIYFEGDPALRPGFRAFFRELTGAPGLPLKLIAGKATAIQDFLTAQRKHPRALNILLLDSERPDDGKLFESTCEPRGVSGAAKELVFWMIQCMESWFLADAESLAEYYGAGFRQNALPGNPQVEAIPKNDVQDGLKAATRETSKGRYHKTRHAPDLLERIHPEFVRRKSPGCRRMFDDVRRLVPRG
jgi:hypothetical protein